MPVPGQKPRGRTTAANNLNDPMLSRQLRLQVLGPLSALIDLGTAQLHVSRLFREIGGTEELVKGSAGNDFFPLTLSPQHVTPGRTVFETPPGQTPASVQWSNRTREIFNVTRDELAAAVREVGHQSCDVKRFIRASKALSEAEAVVATLLSP